MGPLTFKDALGNTVLVTAATPLPTSGGGGGGGGSGDASASNQTTQIAAANASNTKLDTLIGQTDTVEASLSSLDTKATSTNTKLDTTNTKLDTIISQTDTVEASLSSLDTKATSTNTKLDTIISQTDTVEASLSSLDTKATSTNTKLDTLISQTDQLEGSTASIDSKATTGNANTAAAAAGIGTSTDASSAVGSPGTLVSIVRAMRDLVGLGTGAPADAANTDSTSSWSMVSLLKGVWAKLPALVNGSQPTTLRNAAGTSIASLALGTTLEGLLTSAGATDFFFSTANATTVQLTAGATFPGAVESIVSAQAWSVLVTSDQPGTLTLIEYRDAAGLRATTTRVFSILANAPLSICRTANGNYFKATFQNTGASTTTTFGIDTAFGVLPAVTSLGNGPVSLNEVNGTAFSLGAQAPAASLPVNLSNDVVAGAAASIAAINTDLITGVVSGWFDAANYHSASIQVIGSAGITAGAIFFEQTNDTTAAASGNSWAVEEETSLTPTPNIAAITIAASTTRMFRGAITSRYIRVRVSTAFATANVQAVAVLSQLPFVRMVQTVHQATGANLNMAISSGTVTTLTTLTGTTTLTPGTAATNLGKAEDAPSASGDTGVAVLGVRQDFLSSLMSAVLDYGCLAITKFGSQVIKAEHFHSRSFSSEMLITAPAPTATDIAEIFGNATTQVVVTGVEIWGTATAASPIEVSIKKRTTANTAGTKTAGLVCAHDSGDTANVSVPQQYTANPTLGTDGNTVRQSPLSLDTAAASVARQILAWAFGETQGAKAIVLNGTAQGCVISLGGAAVPTGASFRVRISWSEFP